MQYVLIIQEWEVIQPKAHRIVATPQTVPEYDNCLLLSKKMFCIRLKNLIPISKISKQLSISEREYKNIESGSEYPTRKILKMIENLFNETIFPLQH